jgi:hypothetical protein
MSLRSSSNHSSYPKQCRLQEEVHLTFHSFDAAWYVFSMHQRSWVICCISVGSKGALESIRCTFNSDSGVEPSTSWLPTSRSHISEVATPSISVTDNVLWNHIVNFRRYRELVAIFSFLINRFVLAGVEFWSLETWMEKALQCRSTGSTTLRMRTRYCIHGFSISVTWSFTLL